MQRQIIESTLREGEQVSDILHIAKQEEIKFDHETLVRKRLLRH